MRTLIYALSAPTKLGSKPANPQYVERQLQLLGKDYDRVITVPAGGGTWDQWRKGLHQETWPELAQGSLTLMTDVAFGPTTTFSDLLNRLEGDEYSSFWVFSNTGEPFFFHFNNDVVKSATFHAFWDAKPPVGADAATLRLHLFRALATAGFHQGVAVQIDPKASTAGMDDPKQSRPDLWAESDAPFLLIEDLLDRPDYVPYGLDYLKAGGFPAATASAHLSQLTAPEEKSLLWAKQRNYRQEVAVKPAVPQKVAIHVHAHYPELLKPFFDTFASYTFPFTLFITTSKAKVAEVEEQLSAYNFEYEVVPVPNLGRDIYPMFLLRNKLAEFDVVGHFHTKKSNHERGFIADSWLNELMEMVAAPGDAIVADFARRPELGVVIADVPSFFRVNRIVYPEGEAPLIPFANNLWERMDLPRESPFKTHDTFIMSYGTFFWARYHAIQPLLELKVADELPPEPVPENHTILHALERLPVYVAWAQGYDFAISEGRYLTVFADATAPHLEAVPFKRLVQQKVTNRIPVPIKRRVLKATGWKAKD